MNGLKIIDADTAKNLAQFKGTLTMEGLTYIDDETTKEFAKRRYMSILVSKPIKRKINAFRKQ